MDSLSLRFEEYINRTRFNIYLDMDGVLTNFDLAFSRVSDIDLNDQSAENQEQIWDVINNQPETFWSEMEWTSDGKELWDRVKKYTIKICSTPARSNASHIGKKIWCRNHLGPYVPIVLTSNKEQWASPTNILIDDREKVINKWMSRGGIGVLHKNTKDTLEQLEKVGISCLE